MIAWPMANQGSEEGREEKVKKIQRTKKLEIRAECVFGVASTRHIISLNDATDTCEQTRTQDDHQADTLAQLHLELVKHRHRHQCKRDVDQSVPGIAQGQERCEHIRIPALPFGQRVRPVRFDWPARRENHDQVENARHSGRPDGRPNRGAAPLAPTDDSQQEQAHGDAAQGEADDAKGLRDEQPAADLVHFVDVVRSYEVGLGPAPAHVNILRHDRGECDKQKLIYVSARSSTGSRAYQCTQHDPVLPPYRVDGLSCPEPKRKHDSADGAEYPVNAEHDGTAVFIASLL